MLSAGRQTGADWRRTRRKDPLNQPDRDAFAPSMRSIVPKGWDIDNPASLTRPFAQAKGVH
jgi:hypothetical protein